VRMIEALIESHRPKLPAAASMATPEQR